MGISELPFPLYLMLTFGVSSYLFVMAIIGYKKDRKSVIGIYLSIGTAVMLADVIRISDLYLPLPNVATRIIWVAMGSLFIIGLGLLCYDVWTNGKGPNAKKVAIFSFSMFLVGGILFLIAYLI